MSDDHKLLQAFRRRLVAMMRGARSPIVDYQSLQLLASEFELALTLVEREWKAMCEWQMLACCIAELRRKGVESVPLPPPPATPDNPALAAILDGLHKHGTSIGGAEKRIAELRSQNSEVFAIWDQMNRE